VTLGLVIVAGVMVVDPFGWNPFGPAKWSAEVIAGLLAGATVLAAGRLRLARRAAWAWVAFLVLVTLAAAFGVDPTQAWTGTPQRHFGALTWIMCFGLFIAGQQLRDRRAARQLVAVAVGVATVSGLWSVAEEAGWHPFPVAGDRLVGPLGNASYLGAAEALLLPVAIGVAVDRTWSARSRVLAAAGAGLSLAALIGSGARAAWLGVVVAAGVMAYCRRGAFAGLLRGRMARSALVAGLIVGAVVGLAVASGTAGRVPALFDSGQAGGTSRWSEWGTAVQVIGGHPLTGVGPEGYRIGFVDHVSASYVRRYSLDPLPDRAHDSLLDIAATVGLPGAVVYLLVLGCVSVFVRRALRTAPAWLTGVAVGLVAYVTGSLFLFPLAEVEPTFWLLAGLVVAHTAGPDEVGELATPPLAAAAFVFGAFVLGVFGIRSVVADDRMRTALSLPAGAPQAQVEANRAVDLDPGNLVLRLAAVQIDESAGGLALVAAQQQLTAALLISPADPVARRQEAQYLLARAELTGAGPDWSRCAGFVAHLMPTNRRDPSILLVAGVVDTHDGRLAAAADVLQQAVWLAPHSPEPSADLALVYLQQGRPAAARAAAEAALRIDPTDAAARGVLGRGAPDGT
jgi:hypothetical protein